MVSCLLRGSGSIWWKRYWEEKDKKDIRQSTPGTARWRYASISDHVVVVMLKLLKGPSQFVVVKG
jgi:hypothetical protein